MSIKTRLERLERGSHEEEVIIVNRWFTGDPPMAPEERERHRLAVLRVARNPRGILIEYGTGGALLELLGPVDHASLPPHRTITLARSYGAE